MLRLAAACLVLVGVGVAAPHGLQAQHFGNLHNGCCNTCQLPPANCTCTATRPVVETQYRQEQTVTYEDVTQTQYRQEAFTETVPVTTYRNVTVDEGGYQQVWVPKLVTKHVPQTSYQQRQAYRTVPYQVSHRVPRVSTRTVPYQSVRYVTQQYQTAMTVPACNTCAPYGTNAVSLAPPIGATAYAPIYSPPLATLPPLTIPPHRVSQATNIPPLAPIPDRHFSGASANNAYDEWTTIESRSATRRDRYDDYDSDSYRVGHNSPGKRWSQQSRQFVPAPSAATVWRSQAGVRR